MNRNKRIKNYLLDINTWEEIIFSFNNLETKNITNNTILKINRNTYEEICFCHRHGS
jgi:hypothetical protein